MGLNKKGFYFTMDAFLASVILLSGMILISQHLSTDRPAESMQYLSADLLTALSEIKINELDPVMLTYLSTSNRTNINLTIIEQIGTYWAAGDTQFAINLSHHMMGGAIPDNTGLRLSLGNLELYSKETQHQSEIYTADRMITGVLEGAPITGSTSSAYLRRIQDKRTSSFAYFGGFVGQGNITVILSLPEDVDTSRIQSLLLELDTPQAFQVHANNTNCGTYVPVTGNMTADSWNLSACIPYMNIGNTSFKFVYSNISTAYIAGGYLKASYTTDTFIGSPESAETVYAFPDISGIVNLYDAIIIPETLLNITARLHYVLNDPGARARLTIGEITVWESNQTGVTDVTLTGQNLTMAGLNYDFLSNKTVPIRFSAYNATSTLVFEGRDADVVVITDYSASMFKSVSNWGQGNAGNVRDCEAVYSDNEIRRTHLARCLNKEIVNILLGYVGNRVWPVHYVNDNVHFYNNPEDQEALNGFYETFTSTFPQQGSGKTCIACALSEAYNIFETFSSAERPKFIVLMTDGLPTHCTALGCGARSTSYGSEVCQGYCDVSGQNCNTDFELFCTNSGCSSAISNTMIVAQQLKQDFNVTIYTVGFGPVGTCSNATQLLQTLAIMTNGTYQHSTNPQALFEIYQNISHSILEQLDQVSQTVIVPGTITLGRLFGDSYIRASHSILINAPSPNEIEVTRQSSPFNGCTAFVDLPAELKIKEAVVTSYSGPHWTDAVIVNGQSAFNLSEFFVSYARLGDPYRISVPASMITENNTIIINTGDAPENSTGCSMNNTLIYTALIPSSTSRSEVLENTEGCTWTIQFEDGSFSMRVIPQGYAGTKVCTYTETNFTLAQGNHNPEDAYDVAVNSLLSTLDYDNNGKLFVNLDAEDIEIVITTISSVPYLWGPSLVRASVWQ